MVDKNPVGKSKSWLKICGGAGYRSRYLSHAKRALYHLSYTPSCYKGDQAHDLIIMFFFAYKLTLSDCCKAW